MATKNWPANFRIESCDYGIQFDVQITTMRNGRIYTYELPGGRWVCTLNFPNDTEQGLRPAVEAFIVSLKGGANRLSLGHLGRKVPNGSLRGTPVLQGVHSQGSEQLTLSGATGTLKSGDIIGLPGQMLQVTADASPAGGNMTAQISPPLFSGYSNGTGVVWNQPTTLWIPKSTLAGPFPFRAGQYRPGFSVEFVESGI